MKYKPNSHKETIVGNKNSSAFKDSNNNTHKELYSNNLSPEKGPQKDFAYNELKENKDIQTSFLSKINDNSAQ